ncbi:hypothetical protein CW713_02970 [Methanophagales archaeon]|nr:MAG: hypothetical protein CW713_02970 [Methanophagales archaeon]
MRIVIDENVSYGVVGRLRMKGHDVIPISELPARGISDEDVYALTVREQAVLVTRDYHFTNPIRFPAKTKIALMKVPISVVLVMLISCVKPCIAVDNSTNNIPNSSISLENTSVNVSVTGLYRRPS